MHDLFGDPERLPTEAEMRRVNLDFENCYQAYLTRLSSFRSPHTIERRDLYSRVALRFDHAYRTMPELRRFVRANGMMMVKKDFWAWGQWLSWEISTQWLKHYGAMPRLTTFPQNAWLRLALLHADGYLFPLVGDRVTYEERQLINFLEEAKKVVPVPTDEGVGVWYRHETYGPMTLRPSDQRRGGDDDLTFLLQRGYLEKLPTRDPRQRWRAEENQMVTLRLTEMGRDYINALASGALIVPTDAVTPGTEDDVPEDDADDAGADTPGDTPGAEGRLDEERFDAWRKGKPLKKVLVAAIKTGVIEPLDGFIYWKRRSEDPPRYTLEQVAEKVGLSTATVQRREEKVADSLGVPRIPVEVPRDIKNDPEKVLRFHEKVRAMRAKAKKNWPTAEKNLAKIRAYLDRDTNA